MNDSNNKKRKGIVSEDSSINKLTKEEVDATILFYESKYTFTTNQFGCKIMGKKKERPRGSNWEPLARKDDGYLQVTVQTSPSRNIEIYGEAKKHKELWHALKWRHRNNGDQIPHGSQVAHTCIHRDCGEHGDAVSRDLNEEHKYCKYVYFGEGASRRVFLKCHHHPKCRPVLQAYPLSVVADKGIIDSLKYVDNTNSNSNNS